MLCGAGHQTSRARPRTVVSLPSVKQVPREVHGMTAQLHETVIVPRRSLRIVAQNANEHTFGGLRIDDFPRFPMASVCGADKDFTVLLEELGTPRVVIAWKGERLTAAVSVNNPNADAAAVQIVSGHDASVRLPQREKPLIHAINVVLRPCSEEQNDRDQREQKNNCCELLPRHGEFGSHGEVRPGRHPDRRAVGR